MGRRALVLVLTQAGCLSRSSHARVLTSSVMFGLAWLVDARFKITQNGEHVGYYKRSTGFVRKL